MSASSIYRKYKKGTSNSFVQQHFSAIFFNNCGFVQKPLLYTTHATVYILYEIFMLQFVLRIIEYNEGQTM